MLIHLFQRTLVKKVLLLLLLVIAHLSSSSIFAQSILGGEYNTSFDSTNRRYLDQSRVSNPATATQCVGDNRSERFYLSADQNGNGLPDYYSSYYLRDNFWITGPSDSVKVSLITVRGNGTNGTSVKYYTPQSNVLSIYKNGVNYPIDSNRAWYRASNIAPKGTYVRAVESQPLLLEVPSSKKPVDAWFQIGYNIRFKDYDSVKSSGNSTYTAYVIPNSSYFDAVNTSHLWGLNSLTPSFNTFYGPNWPANYTKGSLFQTRSIERQSEVTHDLECFNGYLSRCGDGFIDKSGQQPTNGSTTQAHIISDTGVNEMCDPGANLNDWRDDVMPGGQQPTATWNCSATCQIVDNRRPADLSIDKQQKLRTSSNYEGIGLNTPSNIQYFSPSDFDFRIIITNNGDEAATNVVLHDMLPLGFVVDSFPSGCSGTISGGGTVACTTPSNGLIRSNAFTLPGGQSATFIIRGKLTNGNPTTNEAWATSNQSNTSRDTVNQYPQSVGLDIIKYQKLAHEADTAYRTGTIEYKAPAKFDFKIVFNNPGTATKEGVRLVDYLPEGFTPDVKQGTSYCRVVGVNGVTCNYDAVAGKITSSVFNVEAGRTVEFYISGTMNSDRRTTNVACYETVNNPVTGINDDRCVTVPQTPLLDIIKYQKLAHEADTAYRTGTIEYKAPAKFDFKIVFNNPGTATKEGVRLVDYLPEGFTPDVKQGTSYCRVVGVNGVTCNYDAVAGKITSSVFNVEAGRTVEFYISGTMNSDRRTTNVACYETVNNPVTGINDDRCVTVVQAPTLIIDKTQRLIGDSENNSTAFSGVGQNTGVGSQGYSNIHYVGTGHFEFKISISNTSTIDAQDVQLHDRLPVGFVLDNTNQVCEVNGVAGVSCNYTNGVITSSKFTLPAARTIVFTIRGTLSALGGTANNACYTLGNRTVHYTDPTYCDVVEQTPKSYTPAKIEYTKLVRNVTTHSNNGQFVEADTQPDAVEVNEGDHIVYRIPIKLLNGVVQNVVLIDKWPPQKESFDMTGYSIDGRMYPGKSVPSISLTELLNDKKEVIVELYGIAGDLTAKFDVNVALLFEKGAFVMPKTDISNNAWIKGPAVKQNPKLHLEKYWIDPSDSTKTKTGDHYTVGKNTDIQFVLRVKNTGNVSSVGYVVDTCPYNLDCRSYKVLPSNASATDPQTYILYPINWKTYPTSSSYIPVGTVPVNGFVDVIVQAKAFIGTSKELITNTADLYRQCQDGTKVFNGQKGCFENSDEARLSPLVDISIKKYAKNITSEGDSNQSPVSIALGEKFNYYYLFENKNTVAINNIEIKDVFPDGIERVELGTNKGITVHDKNNTNVTSDWTIQTSTSANGNIILTMKKRTALPAKSGKYTVTVPVKLRGDATPGSSLRNVVYLCGDGLSPVEGPNGEKTCEEIDTPPETKCTPENNPQQDPACITPVPPVEPPTPACWYTDSVISVMSGEYLPFAWDVEVSNIFSGNLVSNCTKQPNGKVLRNSLRCVLNIYHKNGEATTSPVWTTDPISCDTNLWNEKGSLYTLFEKFKGPKNYDVFVSNPFGTYYLDKNTTAFLAGKGLGEYKISLDVVSYNICNNSRSTPSNTYARVCQVNFALTDHYLMQKGSVSTMTNSNLDNYYLLDGKELYTKTDLRQMTQVSNLNYANLSGQLRTLTTNLIAKYEKMAVAVNTVGGTNVSVMKKVPGQAVYIISGSSNQASYVTLRDLSLTSPTTIIVKGNVDVIGNVSKNTLLISTGRMRFNHTGVDTITKRYGDSCLPQELKGIFIAQGGFAASTQDGGLINRRLNHPRCNKGNLHVYGALVGNNLQAVVNSRRSHLEDWFTQDDNDKNLSDNILNAQRRDKVMEGASVYIEQNPSLWRDVPPAADEFLKVLNVSRN